MAATPERVRQIRDWQRKNTRCYHLRYNLVADADIVAALDSQKNKAEYIRELIRKDLKRKARKQ